MTRSHSFKHIALAAALLIQTPAFAKSDSDHLISISSGIAAPSDTSGLSENPAGLTYNGNLKPLVRATTENTDNIPGTIGGGIFMGNNTVGGALLVDRGLVAPEQTTLSAGLGVDVHAINSSIGASCDTELGSTVQISCSRFGLIHSFGTHSNPGVVLGTGDTTILGAGVASEVISNVTLAIDGSLATASNGIAIKPGLGLKVTALVLAVGYGIHSSGGNSMIRSGASIGLGYKPSSKIEIQAYYEQLARYYLGVAIVL